MRTFKIGTMISMTLVAAVGFLSVTGISHASAFDSQDYATKEVGSADWSTAEATLLGLDVKEEDKVFAKLNLAFVYSSTGRRDQAIALYSQILEEKKNPYALTASGKPRRVKTIARMALNGLGQ